MAQRQAGLRIEVPKPGDEKPRIGRVAVITIVGFAIGVIWPKLAGVKLVPSAPSDVGEATPNGEEVPAASAAGSGLPGEPPAMKGAPAPAPGDSAEPPPEESDRIKLSDAKILSCRDAKGGRVESCDAIEFDGVARPKLLALADCPAGKQAQGKLSIGFELDFSSGKIKGVEKGKSTSLPDATADALLECAKKEFSTVALSGIEHKQAKYTVFYLAELLPPGAKPEPSGGAGPTITPASGNATVAWEVAIIRDHPKDGEIVARIMRGTRVSVTGRDGEWYRIKYDAKGSEGWVFRTAIGM